MRRFIRSVSTCFVSGGLVLLPLIITFGILGWIASKLNQLLGVESAIGSLVVTATEPTGLPHALGLVTVYGALLLFVALVGFGARKIARRRVSDAIERIFRPFPIINRMYRSVRQVVETLGGRDESDLHRMGAVVQVRIANARMWGLLASREPIVVDGCDYYQVYCPSAPVPATGFMWLLPKEDITITDVGFEGLSKMLISFGALVNSVVPEPLTTRPLNGLERGPQERDAD